MTGVWMNKGGSNLNGMQVERRRVTAGEKAVGGVRGLLNNLIWSLTCLRTVEDCLGANQIVGTSLEFVRDHNVDHDARDVYK